MKTVVALCLMFVLSACGSDNGKKPDVRSEIPTPERELAKNHEYYRPHDLSDFPSETKIKLKKDFVVNARDMFYRLSFVEEFSWTVDVFVKKMDSVARLFAEGVELEVVRTEFDTERNTGPGGGFFFTRELFFSESSSLEKIEVSFVITRENSENDTGLGSIGDLIDQTSEYLEFYFPAPRNETK